MKTNKIIAQTASGIAAGFFIAIGCTVNLSVGTQPLGAFLFSIGLFMVVSFKFGLYTGRAGYIVTNPPSYIGEVALILLGNAAGAALCGLLLHLTRVGETLSLSAAQIISSKLADSPLSSFFLAVFCGILMYSAVEGSRFLSEKGNFIGSLFAVVMPVMTFILCGFNHSIADMGYFFISGCYMAESAVPYFVLVILGNAAGCMAIPLIQKLMTD